MDLTTAIKRIQPSIVQVNFYAHGFSYGNTTQLTSNLNQPLGTGFVVSLDGYIVTACHVIHAGFEAMENIRAGTKKLSIGFAYQNTQNMRGNFTLMDFDLIEEDKMHDLALLKLKRKEIPPMFGNISPIKLEPAILNLNRPEDGVNVGISGYPLNKSVLVTNGGFMATSWAFDLQEVHVPGAPEFYRKLDIVDSYLADVNVNPGNSGGPVYLASDGSVIGVCVAFLPTNVKDDKGNVDLYYNSGLAIVVPTCYISDLLNR